ncbi:uncharacterized protein LOC129984156 [Argiope bruennichi]|uniref:uncharacterized protein LOC129984156 n=1 Tax=Argiope bruennichi TaxID=94029 RepID=UPI002494E9EA|nr:uncharacterized protein LOC129984156 [Argiope bruennichi]
MVLLALLFSCMIAGSLACTDDHCKDPDLANELLKVQFLPNREELITLCPKVISFLECEKGFFECPGKTLEEMAVSSVKEDVTTAKAMLGAMSLVRDVCDEDTSFHNDYLGSVECFRGFFPVAGKMCRQDIAKPIEEFFDQIYSNEVEVNEEAYAEIRCLSDALELACIIDNLGDSCGDVATKTAVTVLERMKAFLKEGSCNDVENAADLKAKFLDFLDFEEPKRSSVKEIFDFLKKRR